MRTPFDAEFEERLLRHVRIDTGSDPASATTPSTSRRRDLARLLADQSRALGAADVVLTGDGAVPATLRATAAVEVPTVGPLAQLDTTPQFTGAGARPLVHRDWDGSDIVLPDDPAQMPSAARLPCLAGRRGHDIVTASLTMKAPAIGFTIENSAR